MCYTLAKGLRVGLVAPKNSVSEAEWLLGFLRNIRGERYRRGVRYDLVWFLNATEELRFIKAHTDAKAFVVGMEPRRMWPANYDSYLLSLADVYCGYRNFAGSGYRGLYIPYVFPTYPREVIEREMPVSLGTVRDLDFCIFARHDPNIRKQIAHAISAYPNIAAGPLFGQPVENKLSVQRRCRFEFVTENDVNDYYLSEKLGQALVAGCVPVYYGCTSVRERVPPEFLIDMHDFLAANGLPDVQKVVRHCLTPGVYERHRAAIEHNAMRVLLERFSLESCLISPVQRYVDELVSQKWSSREASWTWRYWSLRHSARQLLSRG